jgi:hypothetical protein
MKADLILAVEPDRRQSSQLTHIAGRLGAELILAEAFEHALPAIGSRVPDLILVPALLSPEDDAALRFVLRAISGTSHVQVLTTPLFARARQTPSPRGRLSGFFRARTVSASEGCDPDEFARHIKSYLDSAADKRASAQVPIPMPDITLESDLAALDPALHPRPDYDSINALVPLDAEEFDSAVAAYLRVEAEKLAINQAPAVVTEAGADENAFDRLVAELDALSAAGREASLPLAQTLQVVQPLAPIAGRANAEPQAKQRPPQDEWGLFDPRQCGTEAVLIKLKELTDDRWRAR